MPKKRRRKKKKRKRKKSWKIQRRSLKRVSAQSRCLTCVQYAGSRALDELFDSWWKHLAQGAN